MQRSTAYPETFRRLLDRLGVDLAKEGEKAISTKKAQKTRWCGTADGFI